MGGWNIFYGLINFAILAAALFFVGRKLVPKLLHGRRDQIRGELEKADRAWAERSTEAERTEGGAEA